MEKKKIKIKFTDFWPSFNPYNNFILDKFMDKYDVEISDEPDYVIYSVFGWEFLKYNCIRIFFTGENVRPDFNFCDYAIGFDYFEFEDRYLRYPLGYVYAEREEIESALFNRCTNNDVVKKDKFCNFIYSNGNTKTGRDEFFELLSKYKNVDSGGRHRNNVGYRVNSKLDWIKSYKFTIAFENSSTNGYTTEKIIEAFAAHTIPIYLGDPLIEKEFNGKAFINCHRYKNFEEVVEKIIEIDNDENLYLEMLKEPVFLNEDTLSFYRKRIEDFFVNIFEQDLDECFRRTRYGFELNREREIKKNSILNNLLITLMRTDFQEKIKESMIAIYGVGDLGKILYDLLPKKIIIEAFIDEYSGLNEYKGVPVIKLEDLERVKGNKIVVTAVSDMEIISEIRKRNTNIDVVSLEDWLKTLD